MQQMKNLEINDIRNFELDPWQKRVFEHKGNVALRCGRQTGKSTIVARKARKLAYEFPGSTTLIIAPSSRQSSLLYEKVRFMLEADNIDVIKKELGDITFGTKLKQSEAYRKAGIFLDKVPTKSRIRLKNGSQILVEPTGESGAKIRGFSVDFLVADESQLIPDAVWVSVIPMLATSKKMHGTGWILVLGTPAGKQGYFYNCFNDKSYKHFHVSAENCKRTSKSFLSKERRRLTTIQYRQEYLAEFVASTRQYFSGELIDKCRGLSDEEAGKLKGMRFLGWDIARYGGDENAYVESVLIKGIMYVVWAHSEEGESIIHPIGLIKERDDRLNYNRIFIDSSGVGGGALDLAQQTISKRRVIGIDNSTRRFQEDGQEKKVGILKEDLYSNLRLLMEQGKLKLIENTDLIKGLKAVSFSYSTEGKVKIYGRGREAHMIEALTRSVWGFKSHRSEELWVY
ncbi:MAG TPA: hypothetical protein ENI23_12665 [bacterium]|nr:hypothetical protein [bacterium]